MFMGAVLAVLTGIAAGAAELWLLMLLIRSLLGGDTVRTVILIPIKLLVMAAGLVPTLLLAPNFMWLAGCCLAAPIVIGAPVAAVLMNGKGGGSKP